MKHLKRKLLIGVFSASVLIGGYGNYAKATPLWYSNYLKGVTTTVGSVTQAEQLTKISQPTISENQQTTSTNETTKPWQSNDYWRNKSNQSNTVTGSAGSQPISDEIPQNSVGVSEEEQILFNLLNEERRNRGLQPVKLNSKLTELARKKAKDMADLNYFSHTSPTYGRPKDMVESAGIDYWIVGENIAKTSSATRANTLFMNSSVHRATMLNKQYTDVGIGIYRKSNGTLYVAELFIGTR